MGPSGETFYPMGEMTFDEEFESYRTQAQLLENAGADLLVIETMESPRELKSAISAAKTTDLTIIASVAYGKNGNTSYGLSPSAGAVIVENMNADVLSTNCGTGPSYYSDTINRYQKFSSLPLSMEPNAGDPKLKNGNAVYEQTAEEFVDIVEPLFEKLAIFGSCCGSNPQFTKLIAEKSRNSGFCKGTKTKKDFITSKSKTGALDENCFEIEFNPTDRINIPDDKKGTPLLKLKDFDGSPEDLEKKLSRFLMVNRISRPIGFSCNNPEFIASFLKAYPGIPAINYSGRKRKLTNICGKLGGHLIS